MIKPWNQPGRRSGSAWPGAGWASMADASGYRRVPFDVEGYVARARPDAPCFICGIVGGTITGHEVVYRDERFIAFFNRFPTLVGYTLVAPLEHREGVVSGFSLQDYLALQALIHRIGRAIAEVLPTERLYILSLGSQQGNRHVHWHMAPLPPGVPYREQQFAALMAEQKGYLDIPRSDREQLAEAIRRSLEHQS